METNDRARDLLGGNDMLCHRNTGPYAEAPEDDARSQDLLALHVKPTANREDGQVAVLMLNVD